MHKLLRIGVAALLSSALTLFAGCTAQEPEELPTPVSALSVGAARTWYETTQVPQPGAASAAQSDTCSSRLWSLNWARAITLPGLQPLILVPLRGDARLFAGKPVQGTRYLMVAQEQNATTPTGLLVELLLQRTAAPLDTAALFASLYRSYRAGQLAAPTNGSGLLLFYTPSYSYLTGRRFQTGSLLAGHVRLAFRERDAATAAARTRSTGEPDAPVSDYDAPSTCIDWYQDNGDGTYTYITTTGDCTSTSHGTGNGNGGAYGGTGDGGWGGDAGGGSSGDGDGQCNGCEPIEPMVVHIDVTQLPDCAKLVANNIKDMANGANIQGGCIAQMIQKIGVSNSVNVKFQVAAIPDKDGQRVGARVEAYVPNSHNFTITINYATLHGDAHGAAATDLALARAIIHEYLHVYMHDWADRNTQLGPTADLETIMNEWYAINGIYGDDQQHATMAQFVSLIGSATQAYYNGTHSTLIDPTYLQKLAWAGLSNSPAYWQLQRTDPAYVRDIIGIIGAETYGFSGPGQTGIGTINYPVPQGNAMTCP